jgi:hypothetical protein
MTKRRLSEDEYISQLNQRLQDHPEYHPGMAFMAYPERARGGAIEGIATRGLIYNRVYTEVSIDVESEFDIEATHYGFQRTVK